MSNENGIFEFEDRLLEFLGLEYLQRNNLISGIKLNVGVGEFPELIVKRVDADSLKTWDEYYEVYCKNGEIYKGLVGASDKVDINTNKEKTHD